MPAAAANKPSPPQQQHDHRNADEDIPTVRINPLSVAKGSHFNCELCGAVALHMCPSCRLTYYCTKRHAAIDAHGIHKRICSVIAELRSSKPQLGSAEERHRRQVAVTLSQHALIDLAKQTAQSHLIEAQYDFAIAAALQSMRFSQLVYGKGRIESVPSFLIMAEAHLGLDQYHQSEEYLLFAQWAILSTANPTNTIKSAIHRMFGKLYTKQGKYNDAIQQHSHDIFYASRQFGPEHVDTSVGYYHLGRVFEMSNKLESALAAYDKVVDIWYKCFHQLLHGNPTTITADVSDGVEGSEPTTIVVSNPMSGHTLNMYCTDNQIEQANLILSHVLMTRKRLLSPGHIATAEATYCLGLYKHLVHCDIDAAILYNAALKIYVRQLGEQHESVAAIRKVLADLPAISQQSSQPMEPIDLDNNEVAKKDDGHHRKKKRSKGKKKEKTDNSVSSNAVIPETSVVIASDNAVETSQVGITLSDNTTTSEANPSLNDDTTTSTEQYQSTISITNENTSTSAEELSMTSSAERSLVDKTIESKTDDVIPSDPSPIIQQMS